MLLNKKTVVLENDANWFPLMYDEIKTRQRG
jgi:hypothetical protein